MLDMIELEASPNVYGIETEYSCMVNLPGNIVHELVGQCHSIDAKLGLYKEPASKGSGYIPSSSFDNALESLHIRRNGNGMLSNGGRFYIDPSGPEYDTPETTTAEEAVHRSFDGDEIVLKAFEWLRRQGIIEGYQLNRKIVDHNRSSRGIHLNTTSNLAAEEPSPEIKLAFATVNVAKGAICGSGGLLIDETGRTSFHHSPRLSITSDLSRNYGDYRQRPLVRYPFKPDGVLSRIETVTSDALNFAWPLRASLILTNAVNGAIELGHVEKFPTLRDPVRAAHIVGRYGYNNQISVHKRESFVGMRPLDVLKEICEVCLVVDEQEYHLDDESDQVLNEIIDVADRMRKDPISVATQVESIARHIAIDKKMKKENLSIDSERICRFDYAWDWLGGGIAEKKIRKHNKAGWQGFTNAYSAHDTNLRLTVPPQDTRAKSRGKMIMEGFGGQVLDWHKVRSQVSDETVYVHPLDNSDC